MSWAVLMTLRIPTSIPSFTATLLVLRAKAVWSDTVCELAVGIGGSPHDLLVGLAVDDFEHNPFVHACVAGREALVHSLGIDKELECGAGLPLCCHLVVLPCAEIHVAHPCLYSTCLRLHCHHATVQELHHIAYAVECGDVAVDGSAVIREELHAVGAVQVVRNAVGIVVVAFGKILVVGKAFGNFLDEAGHWSAPFVTPRVAPFPVCVEAVLQLAHLSGSRTLGIFLHTRVDGSVYLQAAAVEVVAVVARPVFQVLGYGSTEILCLSVVVLLGVELELDVLSRKTFVFGG